ncbi:GPP34 family phosphoprotein [Micromonospora sp. WMMD1155]|uniref:GOLPH3/VPS74 family protein n=1 Tax=Micromonospora sp. WMMD1155 TaxID=3016094 RepID=UPI002499B244|nr:GPP34 family phosphoprotein [Micromonospora sp. WMMD1155]WFE53269.1 GPP34 family phosphoprotein [Micromonospora sp. WMMD1155]
MPTLPLPHQLYLLSHQPEKGRLDDDSEAVRGSLLRCSAVAELRLTGLLRDNAGKVERGNATTTTALDPFLAQVLADVPADRPRGWFDLLEQRWQEAEQFVQAQLVAAGVVTVEQRRVLGIIPAKQITLTDPGWVRALRDRVRLAAQREPGLVPPPVGEAVLAALAIDGNVSTVFGWRDLWGHKAAVSELNDQVDRELPGLRSTLIQSIALRRAG